MERKKLKLEELRVQSFITELQPEVAQTAKGGDDDDSGTKCVVDTVTIVKSIYDIGHDLTLWPKSCKAGKPCSSTPKPTTPKPAPTTEV
ncbi:pinensin family lanthipeptide [Chitinophaga sp.]|uniref:pinensin family lanthipeptide n=1 Tax=Chitinophaga sp. TaxID=1869181 RepID=UPI0039C8A52B